MSSITIVGHEFAVPVRYSAGHVLSENEAKALNQTFWENLRNNFASNVKAAIKEVFGKDKLEDEESLDDASIAELQAKLDEYAASYEFNVRTAGIATPRDPVKNEALKLARKAIRDSIKAEGGNPKDYDEESLEAAAAQLVETDPDFIATAQVVVAQRSALAGKKVALPAAA